MTMWELSACVDGVNYINRTEEGGSLEAPTEDEFDKMVLEFDHLRQPNPRPN